MDCFINNDTKISNKIISCKENNKTLNFDCSKTYFYKIHLDCSEHRHLLKDNQRCDYAILSENKDIVILIELKGNDIKKAYNQIFEIKKNFCQNIQQIYGAIVCNKVPSAGTDKQNLPRLWKKIAKTDLFIKEKQLQLKYNNTKNFVEKVN